MELNQWPLHCPFAEQASLCFEREKKSIYCWTRSRPTWTFGESDDQVRDKSESKYQRVQDKSETIEKRDRTRVLQPYVTGNGKVLLHSISKTVEVELARQHNGRHLRVKKRTRSWCIFAGDIHWSLSLEIRSTGKQSTSINETRQRGETIWVLN